MLRTKGKYAYSTESRRLVWENIIWPLVLEKNRAYFSIEEYHAARDVFCEREGMGKSKATRGFVSLIAKGLLVKDKNEDVYSTHYKITPYMRKNIKLEYGQAIRQLNEKK